MFQRSHQNALFHHTSPRDHRSFCPICAFDFWFPGTCGGQFAGGCYWRSRTNLTCLEPIPYFHDSLLHHEHYIWHLEWHPAGPAPAFSICLVTAILYTFSHDRTFRDDVLQAHYFSPKLPVRISCKSCQLYTPHPASLLFWCQFIKLTFQLYNCNDRHIHGE